MVKMLLEHGADVNKTDGRLNGFTPMNLAARNGSVDITSINFEG